MSEVKSLIDCRCSLGEGIFWDERAGHLWWVDVPMPSTLHRFDPSSDKHDVWKMDEMITSVATRENAQGLLIASHGGLNFFDPDHPGLVRILVAEPMKPFNRSNDGAVDPAGRFWLGTMQNNIAPDGSGMEIIGASGGLYRIDSDLSCHTMETGTTIANTMCWSPDARTMYSTDTATGTMFAYDFDVANGTISNKKDFARFDRGTLQRTVDANCLQNNPTVHIFSAFKTAARHTPVISGLGQVSNRLILIINFGSHGIQSKVYRFAS